MIRTAVKLRIDGVDIPTIAEKLGVDRGTLSKWYWRNGVSTDWSKSKEFKEWRVKWLAEAKEEDYIG
jgi:uncharacterized protein YjcR